MFLLQAENGLLQGRRCGWALPSMTSSVVFSGRSSSRFITGRVKIDIRDGMLRKENLGWKSEMK
jgi:hypothetical protein